MKNILSKLNIISSIKNIFFPFYRSKEIVKIFDILQSGQKNNEKTAMFVGGCVRKYILKEEIDDIDIATIFSPEEIKTIFKGTEIKVIETGIEHGSVTLLMNEKKFEITTLRKDVKTDGRHAEITFSEDWKVDSTRRDFTINSIYMDIKGNFFDPQGGIKDLKEKKVKFIGDPEKRITEDYLRIIRFIRFSIHYNSEDLDSNAISAIKINLNGLKNLSKERILNELFKIFNLPNLEDIINIKDLKEIFSLIFPEFRNIDNLNRLGLIKNNQEKKKNRSLILATLVIDGTNNHEYFCHKYRTSNEIKNDLNFFSKIFKEINLDINFFKKNLKKNLYFFGKKRIIDAAYFSFLINKKISFSDFEKTLSNIEKIILPKFQYNGEFLIKKGLVEGKKIGTTLNKLEDEWIKNNFSLEEKKIMDIIKKARD